MDRLLAEFEATLRRIIREEVKLLVDQIKQPPMVPASHD